MSGKNDERDVYLEIHAGAGGTESQDWAEMLRRMYIRWAEKKSYNYSLISETKGEEAGFKSSTIRINGKYCYGFLKYESGVLFPPRRDAPVRRRLHRAADRCQFSDRGACELTLFAAHRRVARSTRQEDFT